MEDDKKITVDLSEKESRFLMNMIREMRIIEGKELTVEGAIHECIIMAMFDESEESATEEGM